MNFQNHDRELLYAGGLIYSSKIENDKRAFFQNTPVDYYLPMDYF